MYLMYVCMYIRYDIGRCKALNWSIALYPGCSWRAFEALKAEGEDTTTKYAFHDALKKHAVVYDDIF